MGWLDGGHEVHDRGRQRLGMLVIVPTLVLALTACAIPAGDSPSSSAGSTPGSTSPSLSMTEATPSPSAGTDIPTIPTSPTGPEITSGAPLTAEDSDGAFRLTIASDHDRYRAGQVIEVVATLTYLGPDPSTVALGSGSGLVGFGVKTADSAIDIGPAFTADCAPWPLVRGKIVEYPFNKSGGFGSEDPLAAFYRSYFEMVELRLPAGIWTISTGTGFYTGADCGEEHHELSTSVTVVIEP